VILTHLMVRVAGVILADMNPGGSTEPRISRSSGPDTCYSTQYQEAEEPACEGASTQTGERRKEGFQVRPSVRVVPSHE
jgi:hypothetical protein